jgi:hypothetical protein
MIVCFQMHPELHYFVIRGQNPIDQLTCIIRSRTHLYIWTLVENVTLHAMKVGTQANSILSVAFYKLIGPPDGLK